MKSKENDIVFIELSLNRYREELEKASALGAMQAMRLCGVPVKEMYTRAELSRRFGKGKIDRMIKEGTITPLRMGSDITGRAMYKLTDVLLTIH